MQVTVEQLAQLIGGQVVGDGSVVVHTASPLDNATAGHITFVENEKHAHRLHECQASAIIAKPDAPVNGKPIIYAADPLSAFLAVFRFLHVHDEPLETGIDGRAYVHPTVKLGSGVTIQAFAYVGAKTVIGDNCLLYSGVVIGRNCRIGDDVTLYPHVVVYDGSTIGDRSIIHANSVIGSDGFGYRQQDGKHMKVPQLGSVAVGDDVEIGACTTIDRGTFQATRIGDGTKIDNLVQIAHNCRIGRHNLLVSQMGIAGSSATGDHVIIAGQAGIKDHVTIGDGAIICGMAGVSKNVEAKAVLIGAPAVPVREFNANILNTGKIPEIRQDIKAIKKHLGMN